MTYLKIKQIKNNSKKLLKELFYYLYIIWKKNNLENFKNNIENSEKSLKDNFNLYNMEKNNLENFKNIENKIIDLWKKIGKSN